MAIGSIFISIGEDFRLHLKHVESTITHITKNLGCTLLLKRVTKTSFEGKKLSGLCKIVVCKCVFILSEARTVITNVEVRLIPP